MLGSTTSRHSDQSYPASALPLIHNTTIVIWTAWKCHTSHSCAGRQILATSDRPVTKQYLLSLLGHCSFFLLVDRETSLHNWAFLPDTLCVFALSICKILRPKITVNPRVMAQAWLPMKWAVFSSTEAIMATGQRPSQSSDLAKLHLTRFKSIYHLNEWLIYMLYKSLEQTLDSWWVLHNSRPCYQDSGVLT